MESLPLTSSSSSSSSSPTSSLSAADTLLVRSSYDESPSYSSTLFQPLVLQNGINSSSTSTSGNFEITVSDPQKDNDDDTSHVPRSGSFFTYLITTRTCTGDAGFSIRRRFRDVVTLADSLAKSHRGFFIPLRPDKSVIESQVMQKHEFVEQRRASMEKYLRRLAAHPVIGQSEELKVFLLEQGNLQLSLSMDLTARMLNGVLRLPKQLFGDVPITLVPRNDEVPPGRGGVDLLRIFKELKQSVRNDLVGKKPLVLEDKAFLERKGMIEDFSLHLNASSDKAEALVKAQQNIAETMGELGLSFVQLVKLENNVTIFESESSWSMDAKLMATAAVKASRFYRELNSQTIRYLDTLHDYEGLMLSIQNAFSERSNALLTVQTILSDLASWNTRAENLESASSRFVGGYESRTRRLEEIQRTVTIIEEAKSCAIKEHDNIRDNNRYELERFDKEKQNDFLNMLRGMALNQVGYFQKIAGVWEGVASETSRYAKDSSARLSATP